MDGFSWDVWCKINSLFFVKNNNRQKKFSKQFCFESEINICTPHLLRRSKCTQLRGLKIEFLKITQDSKRANLPVISPSSIKQKKSNQTSLRGVNALEGRNIFTNEYVRKITTNTSPFLWCCKHKDTFDKQTYTRMAQFLPLQSKHSNKLGKIKAFCIFFKS